MRCTRNAGATPNEIKSASESNSRPNGLSAPPNAPRARRTNRNTRDTNEYEGEVNLADKIIAQRIGLNDFGQRHKAAEQVARGQQVRQKIIFNRLSSKSSGGGWGEWTRLIIQSKRGNHGFAADDLVAELHFDFGAAWQINLHPRPKLNQADAFAALDGVVLGDPRHDAARDEAGNEAHADLFALRLGGVQTNEHVSR